MTPAASDDLVRRVLDCVPARSHALGALLSLFRVEASEEVPTACVTCERRPVLRVNPTFVEEHCRSDAHLFVLVMHELHHVLLGHTRLFPRVTPAHNLAFDAVVNALLCARFPEEAYTSFFTRLYGREKGPLRLLAPPGRPAVKPARLRALHQALYEGRATAEEVFHAVVKEVEAIPLPLGRLLGSHAGAADDGSWGTEGPADTLVVDAIRRIVEKWPPPRDPIRGRSLTDVLKALHRDAPRRLPRHPAGHPQRPPRRRGPGTARSQEKPWPASGRGSPARPGRPAGRRRPRARRDPAPLPLGPRRPARKRGRGRARLPRRQRLDGARGSRTSTARSPT